MSNHTPDARGVRAHSGSIIAGRYQVDKLIARGGMATVYLAHQVGLERKVALKILAPPHDADDAAAFEERFHLEARALASLSHHNIVTVYDFGETADGQFYLAMEYIDGPKYSDLVREGPLPVERAIPLILQICTGLRYAHKRHVVHRDLKPSNILVRKTDDGEDQVKLVDFGLVKLTIDDQSITRAGLILGSPHCMAPEQVKGGDVDPRADIYAVGVLMFRTLTGHYPFHGPNSAATMIAHLNQAVPTFFSVAPHIVLPAGLEDIVRRCLAKNPGDRFQNMRELTEALISCMSYSAESYRSMSQSSMLQSNSQIRSGVRSGVRAASYAPSAYSGQHYSGPHNAVPSQITPAPSSVRRVVGQRADAMPSGVTIGPSGVYPSIVERRPESRSNLGIIAFAIGIPVFLGVVLVGFAGVYFGSQLEGMSTAQPAPPPVAPAAVAAPAERGLEAQAAEPTTPEPAVVPIQERVDVPAPPPPARPVVQRPRPRPQPAPAPVSAPPPELVEAPAAADPFENPPPNPAPKPDSSEEEEAPEGYMGVPDDLFE